MDELTGRQAEFLWCWAEHYRESQAPPTVRELAKMRHWNAQQLLEQLISKGYLVRAAGVSRGTRLTQKAYSLLRRQGGKDGD